VTDVWSLTRQTKYRLASNSRALAHRTVCGRTSFLIAFVVVVRYPLYRIHAACSGRSHSRRSAATHIPAHLVRCSYNTDQSSSDCLSDHLQSRGRRADYDDTASSIGASRVTHPHSRSQFSPDNRPFSLLSHDKQTASTVCARPSQRRKPLTTPSSRSPPGKYQRSRRSLSDHFWPRWVSQFSSRLSQPHLQLDPR